MNFPFRNRIKIRCIIDALLVLILFSISAMAMATDQSEVAAKFCFTKGSELEVQSKYGQAITYFEKSAAFYKIQNNLREYITALTEIGKCYRLKQDYKNASAFFSKAEKLAFEKFQRSDIIFAFIYESKSAMLCETGDYTNAISLAEKSVSIILNAYSKNDLLLASNYFYLGNDYYYLGKYDKSLAYYNKSLLLASLTKGNTEGLIPECLSCIGCIYWVKGDYALSAKYLNKALEIQSASDDNPEEIAYTYNILATLFHQTGDYEKAMQYFHKAEFVLIENNFTDYSLLGKIYFNIATLYNLDKDFSNSINYCLRALPILRKNVKLNVRDIYHVYYILGKGYSALGNTSMAARYFNESIVINTKYKLPFDPFSSYYLAIAYENLGMKEKADSLYNFTYEHNNLETGNWDSISFAKFCSNYGVFCTDHEKYKKAEELLTKSLKLIQPKIGKYNRNTSMVYDALGNLFLKTKKYDKAIAVYQSAISSMIKNFKANNVYDNPSVAQIIANINLLNPLNGKANSLRLKYLNVSSDTADLSASFKTYACAITAIEKLKSLYGNSESTTALSDNENDVYDGAVETAALLYNLTGNANYFSQSFKYAEKSKSATLLSAIRNSDAMIAAKVPSGIQNIERNLRKEANQYKYYINQECTNSQPNDARIALWNAKLDTIQHQHDALIKYVGKNYPDYYNLSYNFKVTSSDSVKKNLKTDEAFIEYVCTAGNIYAFAITQSSEEIISIKIDSNLLNSLTQYQTSINTNDSKYGGSHSNFITSAASLYSILLKPIERTITNKSLIIIPDEILYNVPFECMLTKDVPGDSKFNSLPYLIRKSAISYAGSATLLYELNPAISSNTDKLLAFAPSYEYDGIINDTSETTRNLLNSIAPLPGVKEEVNEIGSIMGGDIFEGKNATLENFKSNYSEYDILHLAMHTWIDDADPMNSKLVFGADNNSSGLLNTYELYSMKLNAKLAVLSACNTGKGKLQKGEGMLCLARGFMYAGCPSLVMTLWEINDHTGSKLMKNFYKYLSEGKSKDEALRLSKLDYISTADDLQANPYYWAGYINFGNHEPVITLTSKDSKYQSYAIPAALLVFAAASLFFLKKKKLVSDN